ncbi:MAG: metal-dependent transcriptional regulator [Melioribacteraceae bacterium]|nr:metal-dependent transcriptional regulator [Melioribacteraceae bacterium]MCF8264967.1 metal-dependent transcriptional regulator [Melioribacteraceae bacterium]MCF8411769.1 metal-dependent transcriptional regulator [Melioribacteraceae bacterium]MCF8431411.1 metal-dependent transcriptional regulator [Melioribacteraceae bacterium]
MPTISKEDYIKTIFNFHNEDGLPVTTSKIANKLEVTNSAISEMAKKLAMEGYLDYSKYKGMNLTRSGEKVAMQILRRHRLWELFLIEVLGLSWDEVHDEAEKLEHSTSDSLIDKIDEYLGFPKFDPHGSPIPQRNGILPKIPKSIPLTDCEVGNSYSIVRVNDSDNELMAYLLKIGLVLSSSLFLSDRLSFDNSITIKLADATYSLSEKVAEQIFVAEEIL